MTRYTVEQPPTGTRYFTRAADGHPTFYGFVRMYDRDTAVLRVLANSPQYMKGQEVIVDLDDRSLIAR